ncbi:hypothetical protein ACQJBY_064180 [Aegilops geniculata]
MVHATPTDSGSNLEVDGSDDWLHSNPTYIRRAMSAKHVEDSSVPISFISGRSIEPLDAYHEKDRLRKRKKNTQKWKCNRESPCCVGVVRTRW